eukprot:GGOE01036272.1.p1 GENE.GGOE01036272.1~~GGOE01036272.1.p1  ORF type:complete len:153 (-),score=66.48 GGOE01036272.1:230-655(-)
MSADKGKSLAKEPMDIDGEDEGEEDDDEEEEDEDAGEAAPKLTKQMLLCMAMQGHHAVLEECLESDPAFTPNICDQLGMTLLHWAACNGHPDTAAMLLRRNADPTLRNQWGEVPLQLAIRKQHARVVEVITAAGAASAPNP